MPSTIRYSAKASSDHHPNQVPGILIIINPKQPNLPTCSITSTYLFFHLMSKPSLHLIANIILGIKMMTIKISPKILNHSIFALNRFRFIFLFQCISEKLTASPVNIKKRPKHFRNHSGVSVLRGSAYTGVFFVTELRLRVFLFPYPRNSTVNSRTPSSAVTGRALGCFAASRCSKNFFATCGKSA